MNALASTTIVDFYRPIFGARHSSENSEADQSRYLKLSRYATIFWGLVLLWIGILAREWGSVLEAGLTLASIPFGALLGVFLLGTLTTRVRENEAIIGMVAGLAAITYVRFGTTIAFTWYVLIGSSVTMAVGLAASLGRQAFQE